MERLTFAASGKVEGRTLSGIAHIYGQVTTDGRNHAFAPGAFTKSIAAGKVVSMAFHDDTKPLASQRAGSLRLSDGKEGLSYELDLPEGVSYAEDIRALTATGQVELGMSFAVIPAKSTRQGAVRTFTDVELVSVDPVVLPSFEGTSVALNSAQDVENNVSTITKIRARVLSDVLRRA